MMTFFSASVVFFIASLGIALADGKIIQANEDPAPIIKQVSRSVMHVGTIIQEPKQERRPEITPHEDVASMSLDEILKTKEKHKPSVFDPLPRTDKFAETQIGGEEFDDSEDEDDSDFANAAFSHNEQNDFLSQGFAPDQLRLSEN